MLSDEIVLLKLSSYNICMLKKHSLTFNYYKVILVKIENFIFR